MSRWREVNFAASKRGGKHPRLQTRAYDIVTAKAIAVDPNQFLT